MSFATEFYDIGKEAFENKDSSSFAELLTDDYVMITPMGTRTRNFGLDRCRESPSDVEFANNLRERRYRGLLPRCGYY